MYPQLSTVDDERELSREAARVVARRLLLQPCSVLALPTGKTPTGMYKQLVRLHRGGILNFSHAVVFNLDEYLGIPAHHPGSFAAYMRRHLWRQVDLPEENAHIPDSLPEEPEAECVRYEALIQESGGLDLAVLGIGENGHIAFNEPGTPFESCVHVAKLSRSTRNQAARSFGGVEHVPARAITMGVKTIMRAREVLLLASGRGKAAVLARALQGPVSVEIPASVLQLHPRVRVLADRDAAGGLRGDEGVGCPHRDQSPA